MLSWVRFSVAVFLIVTGLVACGGAGDSVVVGDVVESADVVVDFGGNDPGEKALDPGLQGDHATDAPTDDVVEVSAVDATDDGFCDPGADVHELPDIFEPVIGFIKGPYLQNVRADSVTLMIQTSSPPHDQIVVSLHPESDARAIRHIPVETGGIELVTAPPIEGWIGRAMLDSLKPQTRYEYCVALADEDRCGSFVTAPVVRSPTPFTFVAFGDTRTNVADHAAVVSAILEENPPGAFVIHTGDLEAIGADLTFWQQFFDVEALLLLNAPFYAVPGNHENILWGLEYFEAFFDLPDDEMSYTFDYANAAFLMLNTEEDLLVPETLAWVRAELARLAATGGHIFVVTHHPLITFSNHSPYMGGEGLRALGPDFTKAHVTAVFSGHNHCYEHFLVEGVHYFTLGGGGAPLYGTNSNVVFGQESLRVVAAKVHHHMMVNVNGAVVTMVVKNDDAQQEVLDTIVVEHPAHR